MQGIADWFAGIWQQFEFNIIQGDRYTMLLDGLGTTATVALGAAVIGVVLGSLVALMRLSRIRVLKAAANVYADVIRGTPVAVQLLIMWFIVLVNTPVSKTGAAILAFGLNSAAYVSEIVRGGILSIDKGQTEAGRSLGLSSSATMMLIVIPQALKNVFPSLLNEFITLLKETSVVGFIGLLDLTKAGDYIRSRTFSAFFPLLTVAAIYLVLVLGLSRIFARIERRLRQSDNY